MTLKATIAHSRLSPDHLKLLIRSEITPLPKWQVSELDSSDSDALEPNNLQAHKLAHPANLAFFPLVEDKIELVLILPGHLRWLECLAIQ